MNTVSSRTEESIGITLDQPRWNAYLNHLIAREISTITRYFDQVIQWLPIKHDSGHLLSKIEAKVKSTVNEGDRFPDMSNEADTRTAILLNGNLNHSHDIQDLLLELKPRLSRTSRLIIVAYNPYLGGLFRIASLLRIRKGPQPTTFMTWTDLANL